MADPNATTLERLAADAVSGRIQVPVTRTYPLDAAAQAFADHASSSVGKLAITIGEPGGQARAR